MQNRLFSTLCLVELPAGTKRSEFNNIEAIIHRSV